LKGLHTEHLPIHGNAAYNKNLNIQFGRCPVGSVFPEALEVLLRNKAKFKGFVDALIPKIDESFAPALADFEKNRVNKVVFKPHGMNPTL
jgi:threonine dehydrogenase-like Zn-dependent dehydrogenase